MIFANVWGIMHDENLFERPEEFYPERFIHSTLGLRPSAPSHDSDAVRRLNSLPFGSGRVRPSVIYDLSTMNLKWKLSLRTANLSGNVPCRAKHLPRHSKPTLGFQFSKSPKWGWL